MSTSLRLMTELLELEHLHYGLWRGEPLDRAGLGRAQQRYAEVLCGWVPEGVRSILDVGCGTGSMARELDRRGYEVEGLAPDPYLGERFVARTGLPFHLARYQDLETERRWDLVLMSESAQYIWQDVLFPQTRRLAAGGHLLIADYFLVADPGDGIKESGHRLEPFLGRAAAEGFELLRREDVTEQAAPTLELASRWLERYGVAALEIVSHQWRQRRPWLHRLASGLLGRRLERRLEHARALVDPDRFRRLKRYELMLFQVPPA